MTGIRTDPVHVAVVTGGHPYDVEGFHRLFRALKGVDAYVQHLDDFTAAPPEVRDTYDTVVFYIMMKDGLHEDETPWYAGYRKQALGHLGESGQGLVVLHHALLAYPQWPTWNALVGIDDRAFRYAHGQTLQVHVETRDHPITAGIADWHMVDETYRMRGPANGSRVLLTVDHPNSMREIAWTHTFRKSRVFCLQSGHDRTAWENAAFREILRRGIHWTAKQL